ncbi:unnamed protein product [Pipistrellus nathusii]|uniref:Uncharacterized protein n=1 Tax=Pipistrellus nathusii TaxID=59473 RepID=A0ABN9ZRA6_PIPNA
MWAAGRWAAARPPSDAWLPADGSARSRPSSGSVSALPADAPRAGAGGVVLAVPAAGLQQLHLVAAVSARPPELRV